jgi:acyl transferase domain-containing protein/NADP-dependent 3-hydroxy acid dehydrogenase YdfG/acyl carrier protein
VTSPGEFWQLMLDGVDAITPIPEDRWDREALYAPQANARGHLSVREGGFIADIAAFDAAFFGISAIEASRMDPQQRQLLEVAYHALEDAGLPLERLRGSATGVFVGVSSHDYFELSMAPSEWRNITGHTITGGSNSIVANRVSYVFDLRGPSFTVDTACSSAVTALHVAVQSLRAGECRQALVGGVNVMLRPETTMSFNKGEFLSPTARCHAFDAAADGYVRSEGVGVVVLKPLADALADGDRIYATILATALNQDGKTDGLSRPSCDAQMALLHEAHRLAGIDAAEVQYVEAHGTGTRVGDVIEATALGRVIGRARREGPLRIGSVKTNIGHCEPASGVAGLIKLALAMHHGVIPGNNLLTTPNPDIPFAELGLEVFAGNTAWQVPRADRLAGINSFGFGGANAHAVLRGAPEPARAAESSTDLPELFVLSARSRSALRRTKDRMIAFLAANLEQPEPTLADICHSARSRRTAHAHRLAVSCRSKAELLAKLREHQHGDAAPNRATNTADSVLEPVFVFTGQGAQWWAMGRELLTHNQLFRSTVEDVDQRFSKLAGWSLLAELLADEAHSRSGRTDVDQPGIFAIQCGLIALWRALGVRPAAVVGHSVGEVAAAYCADMLTLDQAVEVIYHRSRLQQRAAGRGAMLAVGLGRDAAQEVADEHAVAIAGLNGPKLSVLAGERDALARAQAQLREREVFCRMLHVDVPFHSPLMDDLEPELEQSLAQLVPLPPRIPVYSTVSGSLGTTLFNAAYWCRNMRDTVRFAEAIESMVGDGYLAFVEIGPHPALTGFVQEILERAQRPGIAVGSLHRERRDGDELVGALAKLHAWGLPIEHPRRGAFVDLPLYAFDHERHWCETPAGEANRKGVRIHPHIASHTRIGEGDNEHVFALDVDPACHLYLVDHRVQGPIVVPGAASTEIARAAASAAFGERFGHLEDLRFERAIFLREEAPIPEYQLNLRGHDGRFEICGRRDPSERWTTHVHGRARHLGERFALPAISLEQARSRCNRERDVGPIIRQLYDGGLMLGETFLGLRRVWEGQPDDPSLVGEGLGEIVVPPGIRSSLDGVGFHPAILDACFQASLPIALGDDEQQHGIYIPVSIRRVRFQHAAEDRVFSYVRVLRSTAEHIAADIRVYDAAGRLCLEIAGLICQHVEGSARSFAPTPADRYAYRWRLQERRDQLLERRPDPVPRPTTLADTAARMVAELQCSAGRETFERVIEPGLSELCVRFMCEAVAELGVPLTPGTTLDAAAIDAVRPPDGPPALLFRRLWGLLESQQIVAHDDAGRVFVLRNPGPADVVIDQLLRGEGLEPYHLDVEIVARCGRALAEFFAGRVDGPNVLFGDGGELLTRYYREGYSFKSYNEVIRTLMGKLLEGFGPDRSLRVLEVGGGTGGVTPSVLAALPSDRCTYVFTDISTGFMERARTRFAGDPRVEFAALDITSDPTTQGFDAGSFDIVVASDVVHATADVGTTLANIRRLLVSGGALLLLEVTQCSHWIDLVFGLTPGWWAQRNQDGPSLSETRWRDALAAQGFDDVLSVCDTNRPEIAAQTVFLARNAAPANGAPALPDPGVEPWLIFADQTGVADSLVTWIRRSGRSVVTVRAGHEFAQHDAGSFSISPSSETDLNAVFDGLTAQPAAIVHLWNLDAPATTSLTAGALDDSLAAGCISILNLTRAIDRRQLKPHIWVVTANAQAVGSRSPLAIAQAPVWGLLRVLMHEAQQLPMTLVDIGSDELSVRSLIGELAAAEQRQEVALRGTARWLHRFERLPTKPQRDDIALIEADFVVPVPAKGQLDSLAPIRSKPRPPGPHEVMIAVEATALNFRDVMLATGQLPPEASRGGCFGESLGMECAGKILAVGDAVTGLQIGDRVMAIAVSCLASTVTTAAHLVWPIPAGLDAASAATLPVAYFTAWYALFEIGRLRRGERVLIHSAAGGVGLAAVRLARQVGAQVFATAGSERKRELLVREGVEHVMDSRSLDFVEQLAAEGHAMDVVLNSLAGAGQARSIETLGPYGRFVEIGKVDIYKHGLLALRPFWNNLLFAAVDMDKLFAQRPELVKELAEQLFGSFDGGPPTPLPKQCFPIQRIGEAFEWMARAQHHGKVVITYEHPPLVPRATSLADILQPDATYLVTGGCSGFGFEVARWLAANGARHLALVSRSARPTPDIDAAITSLRHDGVDVRLFAVDVTDSAAVAELFERSLAAMPRVRGVVHSAMLLDDAMFPEMSAERFLRVARPKILGAWNLHHHAPQLDWFVGFSSIAAQWGSPGQSNYAAGNVFLDMLACHRSELGEHGLAVAWGPLGSAGYVAHHDDVARILATQGWRMLAPQPALAALGSALLGSPPNITVLDADWPTVMGYWTREATSHRFGHLRSSDGDPNGSTASLQPEFTALAPERAVPLLVDALVQRLARISGTAPERIDPNDSVSVLGLDSLMATQLRTWIQCELDVDYSMMRLLKGPSVVELATELHTSLVEAKPA